MSVVLEAVGKVVAGETHLDGIDLTLEPGRIHVLLGRTGAGKTSLLRLLAGLDRPTSGRVLVDGRDARAIPVNKRGVAFVYQQFINYPSFTVFANIAAPLRRAGLARDDIDRRVRETARLVRIDHLLDRLPAQLSGGQQQRVAIARALVKDARLLLLDEPLVNLDYKLREELRAELRVLFRRAGERIVVYATTEPAEALQMGGATAVLHEGRLLQFGETFAVYHAPASVAVADVFLDPPMNLAEAEIAGDRLTFAGLSTGLPPHMRGRAEGACRVGLRPSRLTPEETPGSVPVAGAVTLAEVNGSETFVHFAGDAFHWVMQRDGVHPAAPGAAVSGHLDPAQLYLFDSAGRLLATPGGVAPGVV